MSRVGVGIAVALCAVASSATAGGICGVENGQRPEILEVFAPDDQPSEIIVATNLGLIESTDNGQTWLYVCDGLGLCADVAQYQLGPGNNLLELLRYGYDGLFQSGGAGCGWTATGGTLAGTYAWAAAYDPSNAQNVLVLSAPPDGGTGAAIYASANGGRTFGAPVFQTAGNLNSVQFSASAPGLVYATGNEPSDAGSIFGIPFVVVGSNGGSVWGAPVEHPELEAQVTFDAGPDVGPLYAPIPDVAQADPSNSATLYFTFTLYPSYQYLAVTHDSGQTIQVLFRAPERITAFLRASDATLYVGTYNDTGQGGLYAASNENEPFQVVHQACADGGARSDGTCDLPIFALAERAGVLYAGVAILSAGQMVLGASSDHGIHFKSLLPVDEIGGPGCEPTSTACDATWAAVQQELGIDAGASPVVSPRPSSCRGCSSTDSGGVAALLALLALGRRGRSP